MEAMVVMPAAAMGVMGVMVVAVAMDATVAMAVDVTEADVIRCRQVTAKDVRVNVERAVTAARPTVRPGTA
jgi:hypothetical protein